MYSFNTVSLPNFLLPRTLHGRMLLLMFLLLGALVSITWLMVSMLVSSILEEYIGRNALNVSKTVSLTTVVHEGLKNKNSTQIQLYAESVRKATGARFVVVGDHEGRRYSHPVPERIGKLMVGGDNPRALERGEAYVSKAVGTLGPSMRGKVPIFANSGKVIGVVSVGYLQETVESVTEGYLQRVLLWVFGLFLLGGIGTWLIARNVKQSIFGLEPVEIARLFRERNAILDSIREGVVAINDKGQVTMLDHEAAKILKIPPESGIGTSIESILPQTRMLEVLKSGEEQFDQEMIIGGIEVIVNRVPIWQNGRVAGVVSSFRRKDEIDRMAQELTQIQEYSEVLRTQTHEYSNKLHTLAGLIQLGSHQEALDLIGRETSGYQELLGTLAETVPEPLLSAIILGKYNRAQELRIIFQLDPESRMIDIPKKINREKIVTILGNLLENALEAAQENTSGKRTVLLSMTDFGNDLIFEVEDSGSGIEDESVDLSLQHGFTTKSGTGRGIGLSLVHENLKYLGGHLTVVRSSLGGMRFTIYIPKHSN
ncbi:MAG TPA: sensor histidine kinase [Candidatus Lambdaproteobacteria bacterium]|nr:sensor histidine kinase [Candidatus Lambdaproteobacteria bacterium]HIC06444.1 sensor histidine kinase [Candidatus Lambdaproteobacteria bacterium]